MMSAGTPPWPGILAGGQEPPAELPPSRYTKPRCQGQNTTCANLGRGETSAPQPISAVPFSPNTRGNGFSLPLLLGP